MSELVKRNTPPLPLFPFGWKLTNAFINVYRTPGGRIYYGRPCQTRDAAGHHRYIIQMHGEDLPIYLIRVSRKEVGANV